MTPYVIESLVKLIALYVHKALSLGMQASILVLKRILRIFTVYTPVTEYPLGLVLVVRMLSDYGSGYGQSLCEGLGGKGSDLAMTHCTRSDWQRREVAMRGLSVLCLIS